MSENMVHNLYKFIREGVTPEQMFEATKEAFCEKEITDEAMLRENAEMESNHTFMLNHVNETAPDGWEGSIKGMKKNKKISNPWALAWFMKGKGYKPKASEGKLPADLANVTHPADYIQDLAEENKDSKDPAENTEIKTDNAGVTPNPELTKVSKEMDKQTPGVDKLTQNKAGNDPLTTPDKVKDVKNKDVKVDDVKKATAENEGKLPSNLNNIDHPDDYIQDLKEEAEKVIADGISAENVAKDLASRHKGEAVMNPETKLWKVVTQVESSVPATSSATTVPAVEKKVNVCSKCSKEACECVNEETTTEPSSSEIKAKEVPEVDAEKDTNVPLKTMATDNSNALASDQPNANTGAAAQKIISQSDDRDPMIGDKGASHGKGSAPTSQEIDPGTMSTNKQEQAATEKGAVKTTEPSAPAVGTTKNVASTDAAEGDDLKKVKEEVEVKEEVKEDVDVTIKTDDKEVNIVAAPGHTQVTTMDAGAPAPLDVIEQPPISNDDAPVEDPELEIIDEPEFTDDEALEMAEKLMVAEHLAKMDEKKMSAKQKKFIEDMKAKKFSKKNKAKVDQKKKEMR